MTFDILLLRYLKHFFAGIYWMPISHIILFLIFKLTRKDSIGNLLALTKESKEEETKRRDDEKKGLLLPYTVRIYEVLDAESKPKHE